MNIQAAAPSTKFRISLPVADLPRAIWFYRLLLKCEPLRSSPTAAHFEPEKPALALTLTQGDPSGAASTLNHLGFRMPDQDSLVALQRHLEEGGIETQRQEGVECCYALQTKFWATDPDRRLWEFYTVHEDLDHSGFDDLNPEDFSKPEPKFWAHRLTDPLPARLDFADESLDEVNLEGTFNVRLDQAVQARLLAEIFRVLRPGGTVAIHGMAGDQPFPGIPAFPGIAALVKHVPMRSELEEVLREAGFLHLFLDKFQGICLSMPGVELREIRLLGSRPATAAAPEARHVMYRGPFDEVVDDDGATYRRGERVDMSLVSWTNLRYAADAEQFVFFPSS